MMRADIRTPLQPNGRKIRGLYLALRRAELRQVRFHDLRHTNASHLIANGESPKVVQTLLGHSSIQVTFDIYGHMFKGSTQGVADRLDESLSSKMVADDEAREAPAL